MPPRLRLSAALCLLLAPAIAAAQPSTTRVSVGPGGVQGDYGGVFPVMSADGRHVAFEGGGTNFVPGDTNNARDIFVHDRLLGITTRVNVAWNGAQTTNFIHSFMPAISADGRYVSFQSWAANLVPNDTNNHPDIFVRDTWMGLTTRVNVTSGGVQANQASGLSSLSADGRFVAFDSNASNLVPEDGDFLGDVFVHDRQTGTTTLVSVNATGGVKGGSSFWPSISADGRRVAFASNASTLVPGDTNGATDVFVRDLQTGTTTRVSAAGPGGGTFNDSSTSPAISADGRWVAFDSNASHLVAGDTNNRLDVFLHDLVTGTTTRVSVGPGGAQANLHSFGAPALSADGRWVTFLSEATNLVEGDTKAALDVFVHDRLTGTTSRVNLGPGDVEANAGTWNAAARGPAISGDGRFVAFETEASNLVASDTNNDRDVFVRDRFDQACATLAPSSVSLTAAGGSGAVAVTASSSCAWAAVSINPSWLSVTGGASGLGNGTLNYSAAANNGGARTGVILAGGAAFTVTQATADPTPVAPTGLFAHSIAANLVTLRWTMPPGYPPTHFVIEGGLTPGSVGASLATNSTTPSFSFQAPPGSFYVRVHALNGGLRSPASNEIRIHVLTPVAPSPPANLLGVVFGSSVGLAWTNTFAGGAPTSLVLDVTGAINTSLPLNLVDAFIHFGVPNGTYTLRMRAVNAAGSSPPSNPVTLTFPLPCTGPPLSPNLFAHNVGRAVFLDWKPADTGPAPTSYMLHVTGTFVGNLPIGGRFTSGVVAPGTYAFSVSAINPCGTSPPGAVRTLTVP